MGGQQRHPHSTELPPLPVRPQHSHIRILCMLFYYNFLFSISLPVTAGPRVALTVVRMELGDIIDGFRAAQGRVLTKCWL